MAKIVIELNTQETSKVEAIAIIKGLCEIHSISIVSDLIEGVEIKTQKTVEAPIIKMELPPADVSDGPTETEKDAKEDSAKTIDYLPKIRTLIKDNAKNHREAIQEKMAEFNADSLPRVPAENHKELYEFLKGLK